MKKLFPLLLLVMLSSLAISAQTTLTEGFYRVQNHISKRYLYVRDCTGDISSLGADMGSIELWLGQENAISDPSCIMYFSKHSSAWDIQSQATGVYELTGHYMTISPFAGGYAVYNSGQYLYDITKNNTTPRGKLGAKTDKEMSGYTGYKVWDVLPVNSATDQYFGLKPTISASGAYYTTFYADFAFTPQSENTKVWCVTTVDKKNGIAVIKQMNGTIPRSQPVIIQSSSPEPSKNRVDLANAGGTAPSANKLTGVYFSNGDRSFEVHTGDPAYVEWNPQTMRLLGKDSNGKLAFISNPADLVQTEIDPGTGTWRDAKVIPHNQAYLKVEAGSPATLQIMTEEEYNAYIAPQQTFTLTYKVDGEVYKKYTMKAGDAITPEPAPTKTGYTFSGWNNVPKVMPAQDVTVEGSFSINSYKLTYLVDGQQYKQYTVKYGDAITPEAAPTKTGHTFSGWSSIPKVMPAQDVTVTGSFSINSYKLTYLVDGQQYKQYTLKYGETITPEAAPTKTGYTFSGWNNVPKVMPAQDITISGTFSINSYKLTYLVNGQQYKQYTVKYGETITPEAAPTKTGYTFSGWSDIPKVMPAQDVTVEGTFSINSYKLTYLVDGQEYKQYTLKYGEAITPEPAPTKTGYTFSGWSNLPTTMPDHDVTVSGSFAVNSYTLTYMVDGAVYKTFTLNYGTAITPEVAPTKEGYTFSGWSEIPTAMPDHDVTITGSFSVNSYKLTYYIDGEVYKSLSINFGTAITPEDDPVREGETFSGWSEIPETMPAHDVDVYGSFDTNTYILTYKVNGVVYKTFSLAFGTPITPIAEPTRDGHTFSGWSEIPETMPAHNVEVNGTFRVNSYTLTYMVDGVVYKQYTLKFCATIKPEPAPVREGYTFSGWSGLPTIMPAQDVTVEGSFSINSYTLTYLVDGEQYKQFTLKYGETITPEEAPTKTGYTFSGWIDLPSVMPAQDVTVEGTFSINSYTIIYLYEGTEVNRVTLEYDEEIPEYTYAPESTQEMEYTFLEWLEDGVSFTLTRMPDRDVVLTASVDSIPTDIRTIAQTSASPVIFDLNGRRVTTMKPGTLYLVNGKKYLHK